jgi:hypothetical protein
LEKFFFLSGSPMPSFVLDSIEPFHYYTGDPISRIVMPAEAGIQSAYGFLVKPGMTFYLSSNPRDNNGAK